MNAFGLGVETPERMVDMFWKDGRLLEGRAWMQRFRFLLGRNGFLRGVGGDYLAWYRRDFPPEQIDDSGRIAHFAPLLTAEVFA